MQAKGQRLHLGQEEWIEAQHVRGHAEATQTEDDALPQTPERADMDATGGIAESIGEVDVHGPAKVFVTTLCVS